MRTHTKGLGFARTRQVLLLFARLVGPIWSTRLGLLCAFGALAIVVLERSIDVPGFWRTMDSTGDAALWCAGLASGWCVLMGSWLCPAFFAPQLCVLWRLPLTRHTWTLVMCVFAGVPLIPLSAVFLWSPTPWMAVGSWLCLLPCLMLASHRSRWGMLGGLVSAPMGALLGASTQWGIWGVVGMMAFGVGAASASGAVYLHLTGRPWQGSLWRVSWPAPLWPASALIRRDVLCLWRTQRQGLVLYSMLMALLLGLSFAVARHGGPSVRIVQVALILGAGVHMYLYRALRVELGGQFDHYSWPKPASWRVVCVAAIGVGLSALVTLMGALWASSVGASWAMLDGVICLSLGASATMCGVWASLHHTLNARRGVGMMFVLLGLFLVCLMGTLWAFTLHAVALLCFGALATRVCARERLRVVNPSWRDNL